MKLPSTMSSQTYGYHNQAGDRHIYIAIPTYNSFRFLRPLASYLRTCEKVLGLSLHIQISDNGSTDKSCLLIQELLSCGQIDTARFHYDRFDRGIENFYSCALAFLRTDPDPSTVFLPLDVEDLPSPSYLLALSRVDMQKDIVIPRYFNIDRTEDIYTGIVYGLDIASQTLQNVFTYYEHGLQRAASLMYLPGCSGYSLVTWSALTSHKAVRFYAEYTKKFVLQPSIPQECWENVFSINAIATLNCHIDISSRLYRGVTTLAKRTYHRHGHTNIAQLVYSPGCGSSKILGIALEANILDSRLKPIVERVILCKHSVASLSLLIGQLANVYE